MPSRFTKQASQSVLTVVPILLVRKLFPFLRDPIRYQRILAFYREGLKQWNATQQERMLSSIVDVMRLDSSLLSQKRNVFGSLLTLKFS